jgi:hypothetical protein
MENVQKHNICANVTSSQTFRYLHQSGLNSDTAVGGMKTEVTPCFYVFPQERERIQD